MSLQERMKKDLTAAMKAKDEETKSALRVILGELSRAESKALSDDGVIRILQKLAKSEKEVMEKQGAGGPSAFLRIVESYLPGLATDEEIRAWISANVDFSRYKNKMQAMGEIMKHFGAGAEGNRVKAVLQGM